MAALFFLSPAAFPRSTAEKLNRANLFYDEAEQALLALQGIPAEQRSQKDYEKVIQAFRRVTLTAPTSPHNPKSLIAIGDLYQAMARNLKDQKYYTSAVIAYDFLLQEYPHSKYQHDALLATARIYQSDLKQREEALKRFELFLNKYPGSPEASEAKLAISGTQPEVAAGKTEEPPPAAPASDLEQPENRSEKSGDRVLITDIRQWVTSTSTRVVIDVETEVKYDVGRLSNPPRIYLDLHGTKIDRAVIRKSFAVDGGLVKRVRVAQYRVDVTRVVLEVDKLTDYSVFDLPNPYRLIVDIHSPTKGETASPKQILVTTGNLEAQPGPSASPEKAAKDVPSPQVTKPVPPGGKAVEKANTAPVSGKVQPPPPSRAGPGSEPIAVVKAITAPVFEKVQPPPPSRDGPGSDPVPVEKANTAPVSGKVQPPPPSRDGDGADPVAVEKANAAPVSGKVQPARPNRNGSRSLTRALGLKIERIIIDPGHGGHDTGTIGPSGLYEKDLVLDVGLRLGNLISQRLGSEVIYTRQDDTYIPLESRTAIANEKEADLFLSIHANSSTSPRARGVETYYLSFNTDPAALEVAARENAVSQESIHQLQDLVKQIALNDKVDESKEFAAEVQSALRERLNKSTRQKKDRGVKKAPFMVLVGARMPSVLAEISFLSNPQEEKFLRTKAYRQKIAEALYAGIERYADTLSGVKVARTENSVTVAAK